MALLYALTQGYWRQKVCQGQSQDCNNVKWVRTNSRAIGSEHSVSRISMDSEDVVIDKKHSANKVTTTPN